jgi:dihydroneopterin aldolase
MDIIFVRGLEVKTVIGVYDWEREIRQPVTIDLDLGTDMRLAADSDDHRHVVDYRSVCLRVTEFIERSEVQLLEALAERIASLVMAEFAVSWIRVRVGKPAAITGAREVGVIIERGQRSAGEPA